MKLRSFYSLGLAGTLLLFASACSDDETEDAPVSPRLDITEVGTASTGGEISIEQGTPIVFAINAIKGTSDLDVFSMTVDGANEVDPLPTSFNGNTFPYQILNDDIANYVDTVVFSSSNIGTTTYTFTVTDGLGSSVSTSFDVTVFSGDISLSAPEPFTWTRVGGAAGTGLDQFGLQWTNNTATSAIVAINSGTTMVNLGAAAWTDLQTQQALNAAINAGTTITQYSGVSSTANGTYSDVLGVIHNGVNYILRVEQGTVSTGGAGTTIIINGQYKD